MSTLKQRKLNLAKRVDKLKTKHQVYSLESPLTYLNCPQLLAITFWSHSGRYKLKLGTSNAQKNSNKFPPGGLLDRESVLRKPTSGHRRRRPEPLRRRQSLRRSAAARDQGLHVAAGRHRQVPRKPEES